jgi:cytochrome c2
MRRLTLLSILLITATPLWAQMHDVYVSNKVRVQRCKLDGGYSRAVAVGYLGGFNYAFDAVRCAPVYTWWGGYIDFSGEVTGRGGYGSKVLGIRRTLGADAVPLRIGDADTLPGNIKFNGYRRDVQSGEPTFLFEVDGVEVEQRVLSSGSDQVKIELVFPESYSSPRYYLLDPAVHASVQLSDGVKWKRNGVIEIPAAINKATIDIRLQPADKTFERKLPDMNGEMVFKNFCNACHSTDGTKLIGPGFQDLWGRESTVTVNNLTKIVEVDEAYIRESINEPQLAIVQGYEQVPMANFSAVLTEDQINKLVEYMKGL